MSEADVGWGELQAGLEPGIVLVTGSGHAPWGQVLLTHRHVAFADEPPPVDGADTGPDPHELLLMSLGACTAITLRMYAARKSWVLDRVAVRLNYAAVEGNKFDHIERKIALDGPLDADQRSRLLAIADRCPIHQLLSRGIAIRSALDAVN